MLDFRRLQYLYAVYRYRNFTRASEELFVSQSTISTAIKSLEEDLGVRLIVRTPKEVIYIRRGAVSSLRPKNFAGLSGGGNPDGGSVGDKESGSAPGGLPHCGTEAANIPSLSGICPKVAKGHHLSG